MRLQPEISMEEKYVGHDITGNAHERAKEDTKSLLQSHNFDIM